jgi:putative phosphoesterase
MRILVISDSHLSDISKIKKEEYDLIIHAGDYGVSKKKLEALGAKYVKGNCDFHGDKHLLFYFKNKKIFVTHGDLENVKFTDLKLFYQALEYRANICIYGHTHKQTVIEKENILFINPGSYPNNYIVITDEGLELHKKDNVEFINRKW